MGPDERTRELYASVESQQGRLSQALEQSGDLLSASKDQADRFVAVLEYAAARVAPEWARTGASVRREQALQCQVERVKEWRAGIAAAAGALAAVAEEVALAGQDLETRYRTGSAQDGRLVGEAANRHGGRGVVAG
jgi:opacity protein-like surface antigen